MNESVSTEMAPRTGRGFSTRYEDHVGLLHKFASVLYARMQRAGVVSFDYDDALSEMKLAYVKASQPLRMKEVIDKDTGEKTLVSVGYNPEKGITFTAYLGRTCQTHSGKVAERHELERFGTASSESYKAHIAQVLEIRESLARSVAEEGGVKVTYIESAPLEKTTKPIDLSNKSRHFGFSMMSLSKSTDDDDSPSMSFALDFMDLAPDSNRPDKRLEAKQALLALARDESLTREARQYVISTVNPSVPVSPQVMAKIEARKPAIIEELSRRFKMSRARDFG